MSLAALKTAIGQAAIGHGFHVYATEDLAALLPALVVGWPSRIVLNQTYGGSREVTLPVALYVGVAGGEANAITALDEALDGPLIDAINGVIDGAVIDVSDVSTVVVGTANALRVALTLTTDIID